MFEIVALLRERSSARIAREPQELDEGRKHILIEVPSFLVMHFPREAVGCLVQE